MKNVSTKKTGDKVKIGKAGKKAEIMEINGAVAKVKYPDGGISIVPARWIRE
jgi:hypothetical protein